MSLAEPFKITHQVVTLLDRLDIPYLVGGSLASSFHGIPRATQDIDIVAAIQMENIPALVQAFQKDFYIDEPMIQQAIANQSSFNIIHLDTMFKVDIFIHKDEPFSLIEMDRRKQCLIPDEPNHALYIASAEDTILQKLKWFRLGQETSDRQWRDIIGVIRVQNDQLDLNYLRKWGTQLQVSDLLKKAFLEANIAF